MLFYVPDESRAFAWRKTGYTVRKESSFHFIIMLMMLLFVKMKDLERAGYLRLTQLHGRKPLKSH